MASARHPESPVQFTFRVLGQPFPPVFAIAGCGPHDPIGDDGHPYRDVTVAAGQGEPFAQVIDRAALVQGVSYLQGDSVAAGLAWIRFREAPDDQFAYDQRLTWAQQMTIVDSDGRLRLDRRLDQFSVSDLLRSAELGLIDGNVLEPYLIPTIPQGGSEPWGLDWTSLVGNVQLLWTALGAITTVDGTITMAKRLRARLRRAPAVLSERQFAGGGTPELLWDVFQHRPVLPADAAEWLECSIEDVEALLLALGLDNRGDGLWEPDSTDDARTMGKVLLELRDRYSTGAHDDRVLVARLEHIVATGQRPPIPDPDAWQRKISGDDHTAVEESDDEDVEVHDDEPFPPLPIEQMTLDCGCDDPSCAVRTRLRIADGHVRFDFGPTGDHIAVPAHFLAQVIEERLA